MYTAAGHTAFFQSLLEIDRAIARTVEDAGCPKCGDILDVRNFPRKPRGVVGCEACFEIRFSFCCRKDGCRKSVTPPSVRFLGRKIFVALIVIMSAISEEWKKAEFEVSRQTLRRWRAFWDGVCAPSSSFFKLHITRFEAGFQFCPAEIFKTFRAQYIDTPEVWKWCLRFFSSA